MSINVLLLVGAAVVLVAVLVAKLGDKIGLPALLLFLLLGIGLEATYGGLMFSDAGLVHDLGFAALVLILADGGLSTKWRDIRPSVGHVISLATLGVFVSIVLTGVFAHYVLGLSWIVAVLLGVVMAPTDSAAVFSVIRRVPLPPHVKAMLEGESGLNDAPTVLVVIAVTEYALGVEPAGGWLGMVGLIVVELAGGVALGFGLGWVGVRILRGLALPSSGLYPLASLGWAVLAYGVGVLGHVSGFAAVYVCAVVLANGELPHRHATRSFAEGVGWFAQIALFVMLGMLASPARITGFAVYEAVGAGIFLTLVARPVSVVLCLAPFRVPWREQAFVAWAGLRGAVPIILATVPLAAGLADATLIFDVVFVAVVLLTVVTAPTLPWVAGRLGLVQDITDADIEVAPLDKAEADMLQIRIPERSRLHGVAVTELRLPENAVVALVIRGTSTFAPHGRDRLRVGDEVLVVVPTAQRGAVEARLRDVGQAGRLARWLLAADRQDS